MTSFDIYEKAHIHIYILGINLFNFQYSTVS